MDIEAKLLSHKGTFKDFPFGEDVAVYKVVKKMFALISLNEEPTKISLKCDPDDAIALRSMFDAVKPGYHLNKEHWNTVTLDGSVPDEVVTEMIENSYHLVVKGLKKADREKLKTEL